MKKKSMIVLFSMVAVVGFAAKSDFTLSQSDAILHKADTNVYTKAEALPDGKISLFASAVYQYPYVGFSHNGSGWYSTICGDERPIVSGAADTDANGEYIAGTPSTNSYFKQYFRVVDGEPFKTFAIRIMDPNGEPYWQLARDLPTPVVLANSLTFQTTAPKNNFNNGISISYVGNYDVDAKWYYKTAGNTAVTSSVWTLVSTGVATTYFTHLPNDTDRVTAWRCDPSDSYGFTLEANGSAEFQIWKFNGSNYKVNGGKTYLFPKPPFKRP